VSPSGNDNEQECAPALRKYASPFARGIQKLMFRPLMGLVTVVVFVCLHGTGREFGKLAMNGH